jgi:hypothetical protein
MIQVLKFILHNGALYRRVAKGLLLKCLDSYQSEGGFVRDL